MVDVVVVVVVIGVDAKAVATVVVATGACVVRPGNWTLPPD